MGVAAYIERMERLMIESLGRLRDRRGRAIDGLTGVWAGERKIGSIGVHVSRGITTHGFAINVNNDLQPFEWIVPCGIEGCRMTSVCRELRRASSRWTSSWTSSRSASARSTGGRVTAVPPERLEAHALGVDRDDERRPRRPDRAPARDPLAGQPRRLAGQRRRQGRLPRPQAALAEGPRAGRPQLPAPERGDRGRRPPHRLPGGELPQRRRVLGARHRDLHDPRRRLHPALRLLQRADRQADLERPAGAAARRQPGEADGPDPRGGHLRRPRRPARLRGGRLRRGDPLDPQAGAGMRGRGADARLPRRRDAAGPRHSRAP